MSHDRVGAGRAEVAHRTARTRAAALTVDLRTEASYGSWASPVPIDLLVADSVGLGSPVFDGDDIYWQEGRPADAGRQVVVRRRADGSMADVSPAGVNVRSRVHEYGGGAYAVDHGEVVYSNWADGRLYRVSANGAEPTALTPEGALRYADLTFDRRRGRVLAVREDHTAGGEAVNTIVAVPLDGSGAADVLVQGADFLSSPRPSPDGTRLAWLTWNHPNMPWDGMDLWQAQLDASGHPADVEHVAGSASEWTTAPAWSSITPGTVPRPGQPGPTTRPRTCCTTGSRRARTGTSARSSSSPRLPTYRPFGSRAKKASTPPMRSARRTSTS